MLETAGRRMAGMIGKAYGALRKSICYSLASDTLGHLPLRARRFSRKKNVADRKSA